MSITEAKYLVDKLSDFTIRGTCYHILNNPGLQVKNKYVTISTWRTFYNLQLKFEIVPSGSIKAFLGPCI
jgi:hypothetical protein